LNYVFIYCQLLGLILGESWPPVGLCFRSTPVSILTLFIELVRIETNCKIFKLW